MSTPPNHELLRSCFSPERLTSYETAASGDLPAAFALYEWNSRVSAALFEIIGHTEVVVRNAMAGRLERMAAARGWPQPWYRAGSKVFRPEDIRDIDKAIERATHRGRLLGSPGKVIAELSFGFWRFLTSRRHHTSLWVPGLHAAFPQLPGGGASQQSRDTVFKRMEDINLLRNRIAHHEPIHQRDLAQDEQRIFAITGWVHPEAEAWLRLQSRVSIVNGSRPEAT